MNRIAASEGIRLKELRNFEKLYLKVTKLKLDVGYFDKCLEMNLVPNFLKFKPPDLEVYKHQDYYLRIVSDQRKLIINQLKASKRKLNQQLNLKQMNTSHVVNKWNGNLLEILIVLKKIIQV